MGDDRIDFGPLDPTQDRERFEHIVHSISAAAGRELAARRARVHVLGQLGLWWRPLLAAAALAGVVAAGAIARSDATPRTAEPEIGIAEAIGVPQQVAQWVRNDTLPGPAELLLALEERR